MSDFRPAAYASDLQSCKKGGNSHLTWTGCCVAMTLAHPTHGAEPTKEYPSLRILPSPFTLPFGQRFELHGFKHARCFLE